MDQKTKDNAVLQGGAGEEQRRQAVLALRNLPWTERRTPLLRAMGDESWRVRKEAVEALLDVPVDAATIETLIGFLDTQENAGLRNAAVELLQGLGKRSLEPLCGHLSDPRPGVRKFIVDILGGIGSADAVPCLIETLTDQDPNVRAAAAESLGIIGDRRGVSPLVALLDSDELLVAFAALDALVRIGQPLPISTFTRSAGNPLLKKGVLTCLGTLCGEEGAPLLIDALREPGRSMREAAITGLMNLRSRLPLESRPAAIDAPLRRFAGTPCVEQIMHSLTTADPAVQRSAVAVLGLIGDGRAIAPLIAECRSEHLRTHCIEALVAIGSVEAETLIESYARGDDVARCLVVLVCGELALREAEGLYRDGIRSPLPELRCVAVQAAGKAGLISLAGEISALLDDEDSQVRQGALEALSRFARDAEQEMAPIVEAIVTASLPTRRYYGVQLLSSCNQRERLLLLAKDPDPKVRRTAIAALAETGADQGAASVVIALADEDDDVRMAAATTLGRLGGEEVRDPLLLTLRDRSPWVCRAAVKSLVCHGFREAFPAIAALMHDAPGMVRLAALEGLGQLDSDRAVPYMIEALADPDSELLKIAVRFLCRDVSGWLDEHGRTLFAHPSAEVRGRVAAAVATCLGTGAKPLLMDLLAEEADPVVRETLQTLVCGL